MTIRELRIRYAVPEMFHPNDRSRDAIHAIVTDFYNLKSYAMDIKRAGYKIVGIDERFRDDSKHVPLSDGLAELKR